MISGDPFERVGFRVRRISGWQIALVVAAALAIGTALVLVAASVFLVVFPILLIAGAAYRLFGGKGREPRRSDGVRVIDAEYRVLSPEEIARDTRRDPRGGRF